MLQPANQATRLLTLGNASPCRGFQTGGLFQQVKATHAALAYATFIKIVIITGISVDTVLIVCSLLPSSITAVTIIFIRMVLIIILNSSSVYLASVPSSSVSILQWCCDPLIFCFSDVIQYKFHFQCVVVAGGSLWAPAVSQHNEGHFSLYSPFICSCQYRLHLPTLQQGNCDLGRREPGYYWRDSIWRQGDYRRERICQAVVTPLRD